MITDEWHGARNHEREIGHPGMEAIEHAIAALDASKRTLVVFEAGEGEAHMAVGGGNGNYVVYTTEDNIRFQQLISDEPDDTAKVRLCAGGQEGEYAKRFIVGLDEALRAVHYYAREGGADPSLRWMTK